MRKAFCSLVVLLSLVLVFVGCGNGETKETSRSETSQAPSASPSSESATASTGELPPPEKSKLTLRLNWKFKGEFAPFFVTKSKGIFEKYGLDVDVLEGTSSVQTLQVVSQNKDDIGVTSTVEPLQGVEKGMGVKIIASYMSRSPIQILSFSDNPINTPKDLEGKTLATSISSTFTNVYDQFLSVNGVDASKVKLVKVETGARNTLFLNKEVDGVAVFSTNEYPMFEEKLGQKLTPLYMADFGFDIAGLTLVASDKFLQDNPNATKRLLAALAEGFRYTFDHPEEAARIAKGIFPDTVDEKLTAEQIKRTAELAIFGDKPIGWLDEDNLKKTAEVLANSGMLKEAPNPSDYYTNGFFQ
ncbi:ABC transporter substrate-binding protein [Cohnella thailandensis]|uniref:ABC transporter substrate-binding protein n=1 Tax=Cohnella thailandensis TaxID=557557 RepID=UPI001E059D7F|nr:ABC-type nitrate/sulfonate/bicarbonate transport system substrate-binding protein [Cohnella thailandensis]